MTFRLLLFTLAAMGPLFGAAVCGARDAATMLVSTQWLAAHLHDANLVLLAAGEKADYERAHIPGAVPISRQDVAHPHSPLTLELPPIDELVRTFEALGVGDSSRIVIYVNKDRVTEAARIFLTLDFMGLAARTSLLDGGLPAWQGEGRPVTAEPASARHGTIHPCAQSDVVVDAEYVKAHLRNAGVSIVDARLPEFFTGASAGIGKRAGHIPGAVNLPYTTLLDAQGKLLPAAALREKFQAAGISTAGRVVSYCHIGQQASLIYFVARYLGRDARLYDGSWEEWSAHPELAIEGGK